MTKAGELRTGHYWIRIKDEVEIHSVFKNKDIICFFEFETELINITGFSGDLTINDVQFLDIKNLNSFNQVREANLDFIRQNKMANRN